MNWDWKYSPQGNGHLENYRAIVDGVSFIVCYEPLIGLWDAATDLGSSGFFNWIDCQIKPLNGRYLDAYSAFQTAEEAKEACERYYTLLVLA